MGHTLARRCINAIVFARHQRQCSAFRLFSSLWSLFMLWVRLPFTNDGDGLWQGLLFSAAREHEGVFTVTYSMNLKQYPVYSVDYLVKARGFARMGSLCKSARRLRHMRSDRYPEKLPTQVFLRLNNVVSQIHIFLITFKLHWEVLWSPADIKKTQILTKWAAPMPKFSSVHIYLYSTFYNGRCHQAKSKPQGRHNSGKENSTRGRSIDRLKGKRK